jgi:hypothetical protein
LGPTNQSASEHVLARYIRATLGVHVDAVAIWATVLADGSEADLSSGGQRGDNKPGRTAGASRGRLLRGDRQIEHELGCSPGTVCTFMIGVERQSRERSL